MVRALIAWMQSRGRRQPVKGDWRAFNRAPIALDRLPPPATKSIQAIKAASDRGLAAFHVLPHSKFKRATFMLTHSRVCPGCPRLCPPKARKKDGGCPPRQQPMLDGLPPRSKLKIREARIVVIPRGWRVRSVHGGLTEAGRAWWRPGVDPLRTKMPYLGVRSSCDQKRARRNDDTHKKNQGRIHGPGHPVRPGN